MRADTLRQRKERLALANISGAMMIQATIPSALGLYFTPWVFDGPLLVAGFGTAAAVIALWTLFRRGAMTGRALASVGLLCAVFAAYVLWHFIGCPRNSPPRAPAPSGN